MRSLVVVPMLAVALVLGCSSKEDIRAESSGATGTGGHRMHGAGGGPSSTAAATTGAGGNGAGSCCAEPVHVAGQVKTISADTDVEQQVAGVVNPATGVVVVGPFFLTDFAGYATAWFSASGDCLNTPASADVVHAPSNNGLHGMRLFVPKNVTLCSINGSPITFGGFKPY